MKCTVFKDVAHYSLFQNYRLFGRLKNEATRSTKVEVNFYHITRRQSMEVRYSSSLPLEPQISQDKKDKRLKRKI